MDRFRCAAAGSQMLLLVACGSPGPGAPSESGGSSVEVGGLGASYDAPPVLGDAWAHAPRAAQQSAGNTYFIHVGGMCSTSFGGGKGSKGGSRLAELEGKISVDAPIDQTDSMTVAVPQMAAVLDEHCRGDDWCNIYTYSNGGAVVSKTLSVYDSSRWNVLWVLSSASNEGGSELSGSSTASLGDALGVTCNLSNDIAPSDHRPAWNHNDTGGNTFYLVAGYDEWWYTGGFPDFFSGMANDGAVAYHSSAGLNDTYFVPDDDPWACYQPQYHYDLHEVTYDCKGFDLDHNDMAMKGITELGG